MAEAGHVAVEQTVDDDTKLGTARVEAADGFFDTSGGESRRCRSNTNAWVTRSAGRRSQCGTIGDLPEECRD